jgi:hypothetical protein
VFDQNKKAADQACASGNPGARIDLSGSFACGARHWTPYSVALADPFQVKHETCQFSRTVIYPMKSTEIITGPMADTAKQRIKD